MELESEQAKNESNENEKGGDVFIHIDPGNVRRKLFQEESIETNENYPDFSSVTKINDHNGQTVSRNWNKEKQLNNHQKEMKNSDKEKQQEVLLLVISQCKDANLTNQLKTRAKYIFENVEVFHCYPECALRLCCNHTYSLIFADLNGDNLDYMLKLASTIRVSTYSNQGTSIVALKHIGTIKEEYWRKFGISDIVYGPLYQAVIDKIIDKWVASKIKRDQSNFDAVDNVTAAIMKQDDEKATTIQKPVLHSAEVSFSRHGWSSRNNCSPAPACDSTDQVVEYNSSNSPNSNTTVQIQESSNYFIEQNSNQNSSVYIASGNNPAVTYSSGCFSALSHHQATARQNDAQLEGTANGRSNNVMQSELNNGKTNSSWNMIQQILDLHQTGQKAVDVRYKPITTSEPVCISKPTQAQQAGTLYQSTGQASIKSYSGHSILPAPVIPPNTSYMVNGAAGTSSMRISLIPDEYAKHSNKERERRERIKESCDDLRKLLPKQLIAGRKQDMATVLELTAHYLKVVQNNLPTFIQQQLFQSFLSLHDAPGKRKRKNKESASSSSFISNHKHQRMQPSALMHGCHLGPYSGPTYLPQMLQGSSQQPTSMGYFPSIYHPILSNSYFGTITPAPSPTPFGSGVTQMPPHIQVPPQMEHDMHTRSQFYNEASSTQSTVPYYLSASSVSRDANNNGM